MSNQSNTILKTKPDYNEVEKQNTCKKANDDDY